jgi:hypothetical protein
MAVAAMTFVVGSILLKETRTVNIWKEVQGAAPGKATT